MGVDARRCRVETRNRAAPAATGAALSDSRPAQFAAKEVGNEFQCARPGRSRASGPAGRVVTVFYDRQSVLVTDRMLTVDDVLYPVYAIKNVRVSSRRAGRAVRAMAMLVPVPLTAVGLAGAIGGPVFITLSLLMLLLSLSAIIAVALSQARPQRHALWIQYDGGQQK